MIHTTVPVHEKHHAAPEYYGTSVLPTKTISDFKTSGQNLTGSAGIVNQDSYEGCPRPYNPELQLGRTDADADPHIGTRHGHEHHGHDHSTNAGPHNSNLMNKTDPRVDSDRDGRGPGAMGTGMTGTSNTTGGPHNSNAANKLDPRVDSDRSGSHHTGESSGNLIGEHLGGTGVPGSHSAVFGLTPPVHGTNATPILGARHPGTGHDSGVGHVGGTTSSPLSSGHTSSHASSIGDTSAHKKPSLLDRLNPMRDADGDGKKGFMK